MLVEDDILRRIGAASSSGHSFRCPPLVLAMSLSCFLALRLSVLDAQGLLPPRHMVLVWTRSPSATDIFPKCWDFVKPPADLT